MLAITGIGRSGTSVLALFLRRCGVSINGDWVDGADAGIEDPQVASIHTLMDAGEISDEDALRQMRAVRAVCVKDPRFTRDASKRIKMWQEAQPDFKVILTHRDPGQAVASRTDKLLIYWKSPLEAALAFAETVQALEDNDVPWRLLMFPYFLGQFERVYETCLELLGNDLMPEIAWAREVWKATVDLEAVHSFTVPETPPVTLPWTGSRWKQSDFKFS